MFRYIQHIKTDIITTYCSSYALTYMKYLFFVSSDSVPEIQTQPWRHTSAWCSLLCSPCLKWLLWLPAPGSNRNSKSALMTTRRVLTPCGSIFGDAWVQSVRWQRIAFTGKIATNWVLTIGSVRCFSGKSSELVSSGINETAFHRNHVSCCTFVISPCWLYLLVPFVERWRKNT